MENKYFEAKASYMKTLESGIDKRVTESYIVEAVNFMECEARFTEELQKLTDGEFDIVGEKITNFLEIVRSDDENADKWYKVKINTIVADEKTGREKKTPTYYLVQASTVDDAKKDFDVFMKGTMADYEVASVIEMPYLDVFEREA